ALHLHLRISMRLLSQSEVPKHLTVAEMALFEKRFSSSDDIEAQLSVIISKAIPPSSSQYTQISSTLRSIRTGSSQTAKDASRIGDHHLRVIFNAIATAGLREFTPDVLGNPETMYNLIHEHLALHTFCTIASAWAYSSTYKIDMALLQDYNLLRSLYRSFIYGYLREKTGQEDRNPGSPDLTTSGSKLQYLIHKKEGRDPAVTGLFRYADRLVQQNPCTHGGTRSIHNLYPLPKGVPVDFFTPEFFNKLSVRERAQYVAVGVRLPPAEFCQTWEEIEKWKALSQSEFMTKYGDTKLAGYNIPSYAELDRLAKEDAMDE
ncbi:hypothetical protein B0H12DRAFT_1035122, partial [Mycena haematopus]